jgi:SAM-dependent methyltransferase
MVVPIQPILTGAFSFASAPEPAHNRRATDRLDGAAPRFAQATGHVSAEGLQDIALLVQPLKARMAALLRLCPGERVLDVGCGPGIDTTGLASAVAPGGHVTGVDRDRGMLDAARARARRVRDGNLTDHLEADAARLPFASEAFDACRCERVLQHLADGDRAMAEMVRVTRPGGIVVVADSDWGSLSIDAADVVVERQVVRSVADALADGYSGRALPRRMAKAGLEVLGVDVVLVHWTSFDVFRRTSFMAAGLHVDIVDDGKVTLEEWTRFEEALEAAGRQGRFFATATVVVAAGRRPVGGRALDSARGEVR